MTDHHDHTWQRRAACIGADGALFFTEPDDPDHDHNVAAAKAICAGCPVAEACRRWAIDHPCELGVWGGLTDAERRAMRRATRRGTAA